jgi:DNA-binding LacI/PurR family transcriptional regulator
MAQGPTIYDVARAAGVAPSTVSRAFTKPGRVSAATSARIFAAAAELGYRSASATTNAPNLTKSIGLVVADITNPFYFEIIRGAHDAAAQAGFTVILSHTGESGAVERITAERTLGLAEGLLLASPRMSDNAIRAVAKNKPVVVLNRRIPDVVGILTDNVRGIRRAVAHLRGHRHNQIVYLAGPESSWADSARWRALVDVAGELGLHIRRLGPNPPTIQAGFAAARELKTLSATACITYNDQLAVGLIRGLRAHRIRVPEDMSVVGHDNILHTELVSPTITTVGAPLHLMGATAARTLINLIGGQPPASYLKVMPIELFQRESSGPAPLKRQ